MGLPFYIWGTAAAVLISATYFGIILFRDVEPEKKAQIAQTPAVIELAPQPQAIKEESPEPVTLATFAGELENQKQSQAGVSRKYLAQLRAFAYRIDDLDEKMKAQKLIVETCEQLGERHQARIAFSEYLEYVEERDGIAGASIVARLKADEIFYRQKDYLGGLGYFDIILTRYKNTEQGAYASYMVGKYYQKIKVRQKAIVEYSKVIEQKPDSIWARKAMQEIPLILGNMGRNAAAVGVLRGYAKRYPEEEHVGYSHFHIGLLKYRLGLRGYSDAVAEFKIVVEKYPKHRYAKSARGMMEVIRSEISREMQIEGALL